MTHPQTIQIFLPSGDPQGIRVAAITTRIVQVFEVPRVQLEAFLAMPESLSVGVYVLIRSNEEGERNSAYIGQSGNVGRRIKTHHENKDFWDRALIAISLTGSLTVTHAYFLEWLAIQRAEAVDRFDLHNSTAGSRPHTSAPMEAECREIFDTFDILLTTLGFPLFKPLLITKAPHAGLPSSAGESCPATEENAGLDLFLKTDGVDASACYTDEGVVIRKGSYGRATSTETFATTAKHRKRENMIADGILRKDGSRLFFEQDFLFNSPSTAAMYLLGRSANGWTEWKDVHGVTLSDTMGRTPDN